jgi:hypothetical protein
MPEGALPVSFPLRLERVIHWERIASRWRPAFSSHLVNALPEEPECERLAATNPRAMMKDCRPLRRFRYVATSVTLASAASFFLSQGFSIKARRKPSPIGHAACSNGYHSGAPKSSFDGGRVGGNSAGG